MKKLKFYALTLVFSFASLVVYASEVESTEPATDPEVRVEQIENRVHEIWEMDFSQMDNVEKVALKEELKSMRKEIKSAEGLDSRVSLSVGAIIIILLIIIIIA